ncbi:hypothetical protein WN944_029064 [Citrus x changshan-huyou]|uniref:Pentatricopeptide repeat-containing protein n=3 Tax=Citrus TaxID=2706 RepID=V4S7U6_CITCL|nr:hypothetical protein CICLE_v10029339mg [Citrus x clementina]
MHMNLLSSSSFAPLSSVLKACALLKAFRLGKQVHGLVVVLGRDLVFLSTALIDFYSAVGCISEAMNVFNGFNGRVDPVMKNSLISGCVQNKKYKEAFSIMSTMRPNVVALTSALAACSENSDLWIGKQIHCVALRFGFIYETQMCNVMLDMMNNTGPINSLRILKLAITIPEIPNKDNPRARASTAYEFH